MTDVAPSPPDDVLLADLLETLGMAFGVFDAAGRCRFANRPLQELAAGETALMPLLEGLLGPVAATTCFRRFREGRSLFLLRNHRGELCRLILRQAGERLLMAVLPLDEASGRELIVHEILAANLEAAPAPVGILDDALRVYYLNPSARRLLGVPDDADLASLPVDEIFPQGLGGRELPEVIRLAAGGGPMRLLSPVRNLATGELLTMEHGVMAHPDVLLGHTFYCGVAPPAAVPADSPALEEQQLRSMVDEQLRLIQEGTQKLNYSWEIWRSLVEYNAALVLQTDAAGVIHFSNRGFLGSSALPLIGLNLFDDLAPPVLAEDLRALATRVVAGERTHESVEGIIHLPDGRELHCLWQASFLKREDRPGLTWVITDISRETAARRRSQAMERHIATGRMAARIAHEFNNPLAGIKNAIALVKMDMPQEGSAFHYLSLVEREINRLADIVKQMYGLYKPDQFHASEIFLPQLLDECVFLMRPLGDARKVLVRVEAAEAVRACLPEPYLREILYNLIRNAVEASPEGGEVTLRGGQEGDLLRICVEDRGHGLPPGAGASVFEPFYTTKATYQGAGLGLGLSVCKSLAEAMGGCVTLLPREGGGVSACLSLPPCLEPGEAGASG